MLPSNCLLVFLSGGFGTSTIVPRALEVAVETVEKDDDDDTDARVGGDMNIGTFGRYVCSVSRDDVLSVLTVDDVVIT